MVGSALVAVAALVARSGVRPSFDAGGSLAVVTVSGRVAAGTALLPADPVGGGPLVFVRKPVRERCDDVSFAAHLGAIASRASRANTRHHAFIARSAAERAGLLAARHTPPPASIA
jgi:hypothetical protein